VTAGLAFGVARAGDGGLRGGRLRGRHGPAPRRGGAPPHRAGILQIVWRSTLHEHGLFEPAPEECASGVLAEGRLVVGSRAGTVVGVAPATGHVDWVTSVSGGIDSEARFDAARGQVYLGADDGSFYAVDPKGGKIRWSYHGKGAIERPAEIGPDLVYVGSAADRVVALEPATGKWRWQYERDMPRASRSTGTPGRGCAAAAAGRVRGRLLRVAVGGSGEVMWAKSLAAASDQFVDVDSTPALTRRRRTWRRIRAVCTRWTRATDACAGGWGSRVSATSPPRADRSTSWPRATAARARTRRPRAVAAGPERGGRPDAPDGGGQLPDVLGQPRGLFVVDRGTASCSRSSTRAGRLRPRTSTRTHRLYVLSNSGSLYALNLI
jgi:hypothetical protein